MVIDFNHQYERRTSQISWIVLLLFNLIQPRLNQLVPLRHHDFDSVPVREHMLFLDEPAVPYHFRKCGLHILHRQIVLCSHVIRHPQKSQQRVGPDCSSKAANLMTEILRLLGVFLFFSQLNNKL